MQGILLQLTLLSAGTCAGCIWSEHSDHFIFLHICGPWSWVSRELTGIAVWPVCTHMPAHPREVCSGEICRCLIVPNVTENCSHAQMLLIVAPVAWFVVSHGAEICKALWACMLVQIACTICSNVLAMYCSVTVGVCVTTNKLAQCNS